MSEEKRFKVTITLDAEDLTATPMDDAGSSVVIVQKTVGADTRHLIEKSLSETMNSWGDYEATARKSGKG